MLRAAPLSKVILNFRSLILTLTAQLKPVLTFSTLGGIPGTSVARSTVGVTEAARPAEELRCRCGRLSALPGLDGLLLDRPRGVLAFSGAGHASEQRCSAQRKFVQINDLAAGLVNIMQLQGVAAKASMLWWW